MSQLEESILSLTEVVLMQDYSGHWYVLPSDLQDEFVNNCSDELFVDCGLFDDKYGRYRTGGGPNRGPKLYVLYTFFLVVALGTGLVYSYA